MKKINDQHCYPTQTSGQHSRVGRRVRAVEAGDRCFSCTVVSLITFFLLGGVDIHAADLAPKPVRQVLDFRPSTASAQIGTEQILIPTQGDLSQALEELAAAERKRQDLLAECFSKLQQIESDYREAATARNRVRMQDALRHLIRTDIVTRHEIAHVAREAARSARQILAEIERQPGGQNVISELLEEQQQRSQARTMDVNARLAAVGIEVGGPEGMHPLPLELLKILDRQALSEISGGWLSGFYGRWLAQAGEEFPEVSELTRFIEAKATALDLLAWQNEQGIEEARLAATQIENGTQMAAFRSLIKSIEHQQSFGGAQEEASTSPSTMGNASMIQSDRSQGVEDSHVGIDSPTGTQSADDEEMRPQPLPAFTVGKQ